MLREENAKNPHPNYQLHHQVSYCNYEMKEYDT